MQLATKPWAIARSASATGGLARRDEAEPWLLGRLLTRYRAANRSGLPAAKRAILPPAKRATLPAANRSALRSC